MRNFALLVLGFAVGSCEADRGLRQEVFPNLFREQACETLAECGVYTESRTCQLSVGTLVVDGKIPECPCYDARAAHRCVEALRARLVSCDASVPALGYPADCRHVCCAEGCTAESCQIVDDTPIERCASLLASGGGSLAPFVAELLPTNSKVDPQCYPVPLTETRHKDSSVEPKLPDASVTAKLVYYARAGMLSNSFDTRFPCGAGPNGLTLCMDKDSTAPTGPVYLLIYETEQPLELTDRKNLYELGFVFDADSDTANNFKPPEDYLDDFFENTDRWYTANYSPSNGWVMKAHTANLVTVAELPTQARIILRGSLAGLIVPVSDFSFGDPPARISLFRHGGDYGLGDDANWSGQLFPAQRRSLLRRSLRLPF